jgi:hypothetical protein
MRCHASLLFSFPPNRETFRCPAHQPREGKSDWIEPGRATNTGHAGLPWSG